MPEYLNFTVVILSMSPSSFSQQRHCSYADAVMNLKNGDSLPYRPLRDMVERVSSRAYSPLDSLVKFATLLPCDIDDLGDLDVVQERLFLRRALMALVVGAQPVADDRLLPLLGQLLPMDSEQTVDISSTVALPVAALIHAAPLGIAFEASQELFKSKLDVFDLLVEGTGLQRFHEADQAAAKYISLSSSAVERVENIVRETYEAREFMPGHPWRVYNMWTLGLFPLITLICDMVLCLGEHPELQLELRDDRSGVRRFIDECLRLYPGIPTLWRSSGAPQSAADKPPLHRIDIKGAMRDASLYDQPDEFMLWRDSPRGLAFGVGAAACLGKQLSYSLAQSCLEHLLNTFDISSSAEPTEHFSFDMLSFYRKCPVVLTPRHTR
ncbi:cytochrome P450 [Kordiimonas aestuarii]|uniref:cytochrome P450 n=1 Tax=Kordiimonas aestuarii TaxID=1005925 RepID=UPI0021CFFF71|nr:cytochrome P450 [Kordiimonas aestuarii]